MHQIIYSKGDHRIYHKDVKIEIGIYMLDSMIKEKIKENVNMTVPLYLMMSYAYYKQDDPIVKMYI